MNSPYPAFTSNLRNDNPTLHLLYVQWAVAHLRELQRCLERLDRFGNINLHGAIAAIQREYKDLVLTNAAYYDGQIMLQSAGCKTWCVIVENDDTPDPDAHVIWTSGGTDKMEIVPADEQST